MQASNRKMLLVAAFLASAWAGSAQAGLKAAGPISPATTLPLWYQDLNGVALQPCVDQNGFCILTPPFDPAFTNPPNPITTTGPISDANWPDEGFYFIADSSVTVGGPASTETANLRLAMEAAFLNGVAPNGGITFLRINLQKMSGLQPSSTFTVTHPYGTFTFQSDAAGNAQN